MNIGYPGTEKIIWRSPQELAAAALAREIRDIERARDFHFGRKKQKPKRVQFIALRFRGLLPEQK